MLKRFLACRCSSAKCTPDFEEREENFCGLKLRRASGEEKTAHLHGKNIPTVIISKCDGL